MDTEDKVLATIVGCFVAATVTLLGVAITIAIASYDASSAKERQQAFQAGVNRLSKMATNESMGDWHCGRHYELYNESWYCTGRTTSGKIVNFACSSNDNPSCWLREAESP